ncbi:peptidase inhibitor family I36 protein [Actinoplanes sp. NBRC 103695]|uniref:peptidase inhibitor family I36 protein n=1 Tax=Actinoplanes sp. NBRC 103695 TaxID=3032202 RepID=UPI0024A44602|nr:peptidase inhibitor family I36 protein [Actinoplanes sp. NBRC 103695]GLZ00031.1 hypothetical protein Acsp02_72830 [Actinoplanes sp. NBRC 103695]
MRTISLKVKGAAVVLGTVVSIVAIPGAGVAAPAGDEAGRRSAAVARISANYADARPSGPDQIVFDGGQAGINFASRGFDDCLSGRVCFWDGRGFTGWMIWYGPESGITRRNFTDNGFNDLTSSWANRTARDARWYYDSNQSGTTRCMNANHSTQWVGDSDNDEATSMAVFTDNQACS